MLNTAVQSLKQRLVLLFMFCLLAFMVTEFMILSTVGTIGPDISNVRTETEQVRLENELLKAEIREYQTSNRVKTSLAETVDMEATDVVSLDASQIDRSKVAYGN